MKIFTALFRQSYMLVFAMLISLSSMAEIVPLEKAQQVASRFYLGQYEIVKSTTPLKLTLNSSFVYSLEDGLQQEVRTGSESLFYVFNVNDDEGFVLVSADDKVSPILGYSLDQEFSGEDLPDGLNYLLDVYAQEISYAIQNDIQADRRIKLQWAGLLSADKSSFVKSVSSVTPLLSTTWNQSPYYNDLCPYDNSYGQYTVTGCVATAMSQIMNYWEYPSMGTGYHSYNHDTYGTLSANFGAETYNWSALPNSLNSPNADMATLQFHCGVSVDMDYGVGATGGSAAYVIEAASPVQHCVEYSLKTYFDYKSTMQGLLRQYYDETSWIQLLKTDLDAGHPIQYAGFGAGGGHTWVCDGYDNSNLFHMNWGWGGVYDAYYSLNNLSPGVGGAGGGSGSFTSGQQALIGIEPANGGGGGGGGSNTFDLRAYSEIVVNPNPINFTAAFDVTVDIANFDSENFTGTVAAVLFNSDGEYVDIVQEVENVSFDPEYYYPISFQSEGLLASPGDYYIGIYYKQTGGEYLIIGAGEYNNYAPTSIVGPENDLQMYSDMNVDPLPVIVGESFQVVFDIANFGTTTFYGTISADLYDIEGNYLEELVAGEIEIVGQVWGTVTLTCPGVDVEAGSYMLAIWDMPTGGDWQLLGSDDYANPITVQIAAPQIQPDAYEDNDSQNVAYNFPLNFSGSTAILSSNGSNIHQGNDLDFYQIDLPAGVQYRFDVRVHDSYNSANGNQYTDDVLWVYSANGEVSEAFDDVMPDSFVVEGGQTMYFIVSNYYQGNTGTYLLDIEVESGIFGVEEISDADFVNVYPNPSMGEINLEVKDWNELGLPVDIELVDMKGQVVYSQKNLSPESRMKLNVPYLSKGQYTLRVSGKDYFIDRKIMRLE